MDSFTDKQSTLLVELHEEEKSQSEATSETVGEVEIVKTASTTTVNLFPVTETLSDPTTATDTQSSNSTFDIPTDNSVSSHHSSRSIRISEGGRIENRVEICVSTSDTFSKEGTIIAETREVELVLSKSDSNSTTGTNSQFLDKQSPSTAHLPVKMIDMFQHSFFEPTMIDAMDAATMESTSSPLDLPRKELDPISRPYAQLCFDPQEKTLVTMLEVTVTNGSGKRPRFCLDLPSAEEFPWLGETIMSESCSTDDSDSSSAEERPEPIVLSGWMMDKDYVPDADADLYWLLTGGRDDPRVRAGDELGCSKVLRKLLLSCRKWKLRSIDYGKKNNSNEKESFFKYEVLG